MKIEEAFKIIKDFEADSLSFYGNLNLMLLYVVSSCFEFEF